MPGARIGVREGAGAALVPGSGCRNPLRAGGAERGAPPGGDFPPPPQELALCRGQQRWGLVVLCLLGRFGPGLLLCPRRKGGSGGQESQGRGERREEKKNPTGDSGGWAGPAGQGASRAGWWQSWAKFGKAPPGVGGHAPVACTPGEPAGGRAAPLLPGNGFFPRNNAPPPPSSLPNFGTGKGGEMERGRGYRGGRARPGGHEGSPRPARTP